MDLFDSLKDRVLSSVFAQGTGAASGGQEAGVDPAATHGVLEGVIALVRDQGLAVMMKTFDQKGLKDVFASWVSTGSNLPVSADQIREALGGQTVEAMARRVGIPPGQVSAMLSKILPGVVDAMTPGGSIDEAVAAGEAPAS